MIPIEKVKLIVNTYETLEKELAYRDINKKDFVKKSKEYSSIGEIINEAKGYIGFEKEKKELEKIINEKNGDKEMIKLAENELTQMSIKRKEYEKKLKIYLLPRDEADTKNAILEIRAGTGGLEATLFVADLYKMYEKVCLNNRWSFEIINISKSDAGGFKEVILLIKGNNIYSFLKYESGVHRVQRVPKTETQGRIHTSAATVAVLPEAEEVDVNINTEDLNIDIFHASGHGGQSVNKVATAIRITHTPTGIVAVCQDERSQLKNKEKAMSVLRSRVLDQRIRDSEEERSAERKAQIGSGDRSQKIRTYNFPQERITDHRINLSTHNLELVLNGDLDIYIEKLIDHEQSMLLEQS